MKNRLAALQQKLDAAIKAYREHEDNEPTAEAAADHAAKSAQLKAAVDAALAKVTAEKELVDAERALVGRPEGREPVIEGGEDRARADQKAGFRTFGEFAFAVVRAGTGQMSDKRLQYEAAAPTTFGREAVGADGGYLVPPEFGRAIWQHSLDEGSFVPLTSNFPVEGNSMVFPKDETTPWGTNGVRAYWQNEGVAGTQTKPVIGSLEMRLKRLTALIPVTDELLADSLTAPQYVTQLAGRSIAWKTNAAIVSGTGNGQPLGFVNGGSLISVAAEAAQTAATINATNVSKMFGRQPRITSKCRWLVNHDAWAQLPVMVVGQQPVFTPDFKSSPDGVLMGVPVVRSQVCQTLGTAGDIYLVNFEDYVTITKAGGIDVATSMHLFFDAHATAFRLTFRIDGQPWYSAAISPNNGSNTLSGFVQVATRN
jgi:HK97 family phage major capsid protein